MCGIAGIVGPGAERHQGAVARMLDALVHRGPDEAGTWVGPSATLGTRRLAIIDPVGGHQPVIDEAAGVVVVANGELYGHDRVRAAHPDHPYRSDGDIEIVPALHRAHGDAFVAEVPGTFALALWEAGPQQLTLARDPFGERPLYVAERNDGLLLFASEPQALRASGLVDVELDRDVLAHVVRQGYVPPGRCIWHGIRSLGPGQLLRYRPGVGPSMVERWWHPPEVQEPCGGTSDPVAWFRQALERSVQDQLVADVPLGTFLSGGIDSSTVAALAARHHPRIDGFAFDMPEDSELPFARAVAERHAIDLHVLRPSGVDLVEALQDVATTWGEPLADSSTVPTLLLSRFVRGSVKVALTGDGADELLGGYLCWARSMLDPADPARRAQEASPRRWWRSARPDPASVPKGTAVARGYADFRSYFSAEELRALGLPGVSGDDVDLSTYGRGTADDIARFDLDHYLAGDILVKTDRASMAAGLEVRAPFLGREVAEGCLRLPARWKVDADTEKLLLRQAFADLLPPEVLARPKQGFGSPMARWLAEPAVAELIQAELVDSSAPIFDVLDHAAVQPHLAALDQRTWTLLTVATWWRVHRPGGARSPA